MNPLEKIVFRLAGITAAFGFIVSPNYADGLPGEFLLSNRWRDLLSAYSSLTNPAFLTDKDHITVRGAFAPVMQGAFKLWEIGITVPLGSGHAVGACVIGENDGEIQSAMFDNADNRLVAGGSAGGNNNTFTMLTYAINPWSRLSIGVNCNIACQSNFGEPLWGIGLDLGCSYRFPEHAIAGNHSAGISMLNLITPSMSPSVFEPGNAGRYSRKLRLSWNADFWKQRLESGLDVDINDLWAKKDEFRSLYDGVGSGKRLEWGAAWRLGAWFRQIIVMYLQLGFGEQAVEYWGVAGGVKVPLPKTATHVTTLYQYNIKTEGTLASSHTLYLITRIGKKRPEAPAPKMIERMAEKRNEEKQVRQDSLESIRRKRMRDSLELIKLKKIEGLKIEEQEEYVRITAEELAIHFASGSADLPPEGTGVLQKIAGFLKSYPNHPVTIEGHTDSDPIIGVLKSRYPDNMALSDARAENVRKYFIEQEHLPESLFIAEGFGESQPVAPNTTEEEKRKNRRVVITVKK